MPMAKVIKQYLDKHGVKYDVIEHAHTSSSMRTAEAAGIPGDQLAKSVVLKDGKGCLMAVLPATHRLDVECLNTWLNRKLELIPEDRLLSLFTDCEPGAIPPVGSAYGVSTAIDGVLDRQTDIYFEAGDHRELIHVNGAQFATIEAHAKHGCFSHHV